MEHIGSYAFLGTNEIDLYFASDVLPAYLDENWDHGTRGYYVGVTDITTDGDFKYATLTSGDIAIIEYLGSDTHVDLSVLDFGAPITAIGGSAFKDSTVTSVILPETLTSIQAEAFQYCALDSITIPASVTFIGREAFAHTAIQSLTFAEGSKLTVIEQYAFEKTKNLTSVTLPKSLTTMGTGAFSESGLTTLIFENGIKLTEIPQRAFAETELTAVNLPDSVTLVNHNAFNNVTTLKSVSFGNNDGIRLMSNAFYHTGLESLHIPANVTYIGEYCFVALPNLKEFTVDANNPNYTAVDGLLLTKSGRKLIAVPAGRTGSLTVPLSVEEIGFGAFEESKLSEILFLEDANILTFGYRAFFKAENITTITVPASVVSIDYYAFAYCKNLETVIFAEGNQLKGIYEGAFLGDINLVNITIPDSIVEISDFAFYGCSKIDKLPISENNNIKGIYDYAFAYTDLKGEFTTPETLIDIGNYAFLGTKLTKVTIPDTNKKQLIIGIGAFEDCNKLEEITLPFIGASYEDEKISWFGYIFGAGAYKANETYVPESLKTVTITEGITAIYTGGFAYCTGLEKINVPHSVSVLWNDAFMNTTATYELSNSMTTYWQDTTTNKVYPYVRQGHFGTGITGEWTLAEGVTQIGEKAFYGCTNLSGLKTLPDSLTSIGSYAFYNCSGLTELTLPDKIGSINGWAFYGCSNLKRITLPANLKTIGWESFYGCSSLESLELPDQVRSIDRFAFIGCKNLKRVTIPASVTSIGQYAFDSCSSLEKVYITDLVAWCNISFNASNPLNKGAELYLNGELVTDLVIPDEVNTISDGLFGSCTGLRSVTIPDHVTVIGGGAFANCDDLTNVSIGDGVTTIGANAFNGCSNLKTVTMGDSVTFIDSRAFYQCGNLKEVHVSDIATWCNIDFDYFDSNPMYNGAALYHNGEMVTDLVIPEGVTAIRDYAFYKCVGLEYITTSDSLTDIGIYAFYQCYDLRNVSLSDSVVTIGVYAFAGCQKMTTATIGSSVTTINGSAFMGCISLYKLVNNSTLTLTMGGTDYGNVAYYAKMIIDKDGNRTCLSTDTTEYIYTADDFLFVKENEKYKLIAYLGSEKTVTLPESINGNPYTIYQFRGGVNVIIPDGATKIDYDAFRGSTTLESIVIPEGVTSIGSDAFDGCSNLSSITIPSSMTSIGTYAFQACGKLKEVHLSDLTVWSRIYFYNAVSCPFNSGADLYLNGELVTDLVIPEGVTSIGDFAFNSCGSLTSVTIPDSVTAIGQYAFYGCPNLKRITIPDSVTTIETNAISGDVEVYFAGEAPSFRMIDGILYNADITKIVSVTDAIPSKVVIPDSVTSIEPNAFLGRTNITEVVIGKGVTTIGNSAFANCSNLTRITIPPNVTSISYYVFDGCSNLNEVYITDMTAWCNIKFNTLNGRASNPMHYGADLYLNGSLVTDLVIPDGVTKIDYSAFYGCESLTSVVIPETVTVINSSAFKGCVNLTSVTIPEGVITIGDSAYYNCDSLTSITIPDSVTTIDNYAFAYCDNLQRVTIGSGVKSFGLGAFQNCQAMSEVYITDIVAWCNIESGDSASNPLKNGADLYLNGEHVTDLVIPEGVVSIGNYAFNGCQNLNTITIPASLTTIGTSAFYCQKEYIVAEENEVFCSVDGIMYDKPATKILRVPTDLAGNVVIPNGVTEIVASAFSGREKLTSITIPNSVTVINNNAFYECAGLTRITIPDSVTVLESSAFYKCSNLKEVVIGDGVTVIGDNAFSECSSLTNVTLGGSLTSLGHHAFGNCGSLTSIIIPDSVTTLENNVFHGCSKLANVTLGSGVTTIGYSAFNGCTQLVRVKIPDSVTTIDNYAFSGCTYLVSVTLGSGVTSIAAGSFDKCTNLYEVINRSDLTLTMGDKGNGYVAYYAKVIVDKDGNKTYKTNATDLEYVKTEDGFLFEKENGEYTLIAYLGGKETITLPESIDGQSYEIYRFRGGVNVIIPGTITTISKEAFFNCGTLRSVTIQEGVTTIDTYAFYYCLNLKSVSIPDSVTSIGGWTFAYSSSLQSVNIPQRVNQISDYLFYNCSSLTSIDIPDEVTYIGASAFNGCSLLDEIAIPDRVTFVGKDAFYNTAYFNDSGNWESGALINNGWLIDVADDTKYIPLDNIKGVLFGAYNGCQLLKNVLWIDGITGTTNVETIVLSHLTNGLPSTSQLLTLKNIVLLDSVGLTELREYANVFSKISGVTIYVEADEEDLRWDDNFPGWNNGNKVVYGDDWAWSHFYDSNGNLALSEPRLVTKIILRPVIDVPTPSDDYAYELIGWDMDEDGIADSIPATSLLSVTAHPIFKQVPRTHIVEFVDADGTIYRSEELLYGTAITMPVEPVRKGYTFLGWEGYTDGMVVEADAKFIALWKHNGNGHVWSTPKIVSPTCTEVGYMVSSCSICEEEIRTDFVSELGHSWNEVQIERPATCVENGCGQRTCLTCGASEEVVIEALGHSLTTRVNIKVTCSVEGELLHICVHCGITMIEKRPVLAHQYEKQYTTQEGIEWLLDQIEDVFYGYEGDTPYYYECVDCGHVRTKSQYDSGSNVSTMGVCNHDPSEWFIIYDATCDEQGVEGQYCVICDELIVMRIRAGHNFGEWVETTAPACTTVGAERRDCVNCDHYETRDIAALGHDEEAHDAQAPTCTEVGWSAYATCSRCDYITCVELPALGHTHSEYGHDETKHWNICSVCGKDYGETAHNFTDGDCICGARQVAVTAIGAINYTVSGQTITVKYDLACKVGYLVDSSYVVIDAVANEDGSYSFTAPEGVTEVLLVVIGDVDQDGDLDLDDTDAHGAALQPDAEELSAEEKFAADVNGNGKLNSADLILIGRSILETTNSLYKPFEW